MEAAGPRGNGLGFYQSLLYVPLPRLVILDAPFRLFARDLHHLRHVVYTFRPVKLLIVGDAGGAKINLVSAFPFIFHILGRLLASQLWHRY